MRISRSIFLFCAVALLSAKSQSSEATNHTYTPVNTYSIIAYDSATGQFGAAVQSHWFRVADVIWVQPGVGAVATQSLVDFAYGPLGIEMMRLGKTSRQALAGLLASDSLNAIRQVAMIDKNGLVSTHTGNKCIAEAGHRSGKFYSCQANLMRNHTVWDAMAIAFENTTGDLSERMMAALEAAQKEGGDIRGMQSAAMVVVTGKPTGQSWRDKIVDIRVDDADQPLVELRRLLDVTHAYDHMNRGDELIAIGKMDSAAVEYGAAMTLAPDNLEIQFWHAVTLVTSNELERSLPIFERIFKADDSWRILIPRLVESELLPNDQSVIAKILAQ
ncbi:MAG: DUF1028 domain-containing protein [candidate division Zixibacteria bacterium]|nr:DUF1028 domain-containing protein [candidate division Zixibacteria bacterium]